MLLKCMKYDELWDHKQTSYLNGMFHPTNVEKTKNVYSSTIKVRRRSYSNKVGANRWWDKPSKAMPAPSTLRMQHLRKLATSSSNSGVEARQMLNFINTMGKLKANQKNFYSSSTGPHSSGPQNTPKSNNKSKWIEKVIKIVIKIVIIFGIGFIIRWFINDIFDVNVFVDYTNWISITYYSFMSGLSVFINELLNLIDGPKIPFGGGVDLPSNIKEYSGKEINTGVKGIVNTMDNSVGNSGGQGSSSGNNYSGGFGGNNGVQGSSSGERPVSSSSSSGERPVSSSSSVERPVNAMSLTQMCNPTISEYPHIDINGTYHFLKPLDKDSFTRMQEVLTRERDAFRKNNNKPRGSVTLADLGYRFRNNNNNVTGSVITEIIILKNTNPSFNKVSGQWNVDKIINSDGKEPCVLKRGPGVMVDKLKP